MNQAQIQALWDQIDANQSRLAACPGHDFHPIPRTDRTDVFDYRCARCGGIIGAIAHQWYSRGISDERSAGSERQLRELLALRHNCGKAYLYMDDGELQCPGCGVDFLRDTPEQIRQRLVAANKRDGDA